MFTEDAKQKLIELTEQKAESDREITALAQKLLRAEVLQKFKEMLERDLHEIAELEQAIPGDVETLVDIMTERD
jgi:hypothetical protein